MGLFFKFVLDLAFFEGHECGFHVVWIDKHGMGSILCAQNDEAGIDTIDFKDLPVFDVFEHIARFYHGFSSLGLSGV